VAAPSWLALWAVLPFGAQGYQPKLQPASDEAQQALARFVLPPGFRASLFAAEPRLAHPVAFDADQDGRRVYVVETFRRDVGVTDIREHMDWLDDDLACKTVADRVAMYRKHLGSAFADFELHHERVRLLVDADGDGQADADHVFADGFNDPADGIAAGVLSTARGVYFTCIPHLWFLRDEDGDGRSDRRQPLSSGYGVRVALGGHDLHGLAVGPEGKLYFSCGDRGFNLATGRGDIDHSRSGAVLRCEMDGSDLEIFATGLRNPQELAFDEFGELFTGDNNSDGGDKARWVHVVEGGDSGWRQAYQWITEPSLRGPWNAEEMWLPQRPGQPAHALPPLANVGDGPSGLCYQPGTALGGSHAQTFFLCDFRGEARLSGIHALRVKPQGASFELAQDEWFLRGCLVTDCAFGPDGALWFSDWVHGWNLTGKGRIYRALAEQGAGLAAQRETSKLLAQGMAGRTPQELGRALAHADRRVRQEAQFELAARGSAGRNVFFEALASADRELVRLHAVWGLAQMARRGATIEIDALAGALADAEPRVRAQAARALGELRAGTARSSLENLLADSDERPQVQAAIALGKLAQAESLPPLLSLLARTSDEQRVLRHAAVMGLTGCARGESLRALAQDPRPAVRMGAVLALRRKRDARGLAAFLRDPDPQVGRTAIAAIYDEELDEALPALAELAENAEALAASVDPHAARRVLAACLRLGSNESGLRLVRAVACSKLALDLRVEALDHLRRWNEPPGRDPVTGEWRPMPVAERRDEGAHEWLSLLALDLSSIVTSAEAPELGLAWLRWVRESDLDVPASVVRALASEPHPLRVRSAALETLARIAPRAMPDEGLLEFARKLLDDAEPQLRAGAFEILFRAAPDQAFHATRALLERASDSASVPELRSAYAALARLATSAADEQLAAHLERLERGDLPADVTLDLIDAAERRAQAQDSSSRLAAALAERARSRAEAGSLAPFLDGLHGGDPERGRKLFREKSELTCLRCHAIEDWDQSEVGPNLRGVGARLTRLELLESIVEPNRRQAEGWQETLFVLDDESAVAGRVVSSADGRLRLVRSDGMHEDLELERIQSQRPGLSAMPEGLAQYLSAREMRDLIAYLASLTR
jgi:quinoprotein glucose dehydrogenase